MLMALFWQEKLGLEAALAAVKLQSDRGGVWSRIKQSAGKIQI